MKQHNMHTAHFTWLNRLFIMCLWLFPVGFFLVHGWITIFSFVLALIAVILLMQKTSATLTWNGSNQLVVITLCAGVCAILITSALRGTLMPAMLDGPSRYLLVIPIFLALQKQQINFTRLFASACPITLLMFAAYSLYHPSFFQNYITEVPRINARAMHDPDLLGFYTMTLGFICLYGLNWARDRYVLAYLKIAGFIAGVVLSLFAQCRSGWLTGFVLLLVWLFLKRRTISAKKIILLAAIAVALGIFLFYYSDVVHMRIMQSGNDIMQWLNGKNKDTSCGTRLTMWLISWHLFLLHPFQGYGDHNLLCMFTNPDITKVATPLTLDIMQKIGPHNDLLESMVLSGIFGLMASVLIIFTPLLLFWRIYLKAKNTQISTTCLQGLCFTLGVFVNGIFNGVLVLKMSITFYAVVVFALLATALWQQKNTI